MNASSIMTPNGIFDTLPFWQYRWMLAVVFLVFVGIGLVVYLWRRQTKEHRQLDLDSQIVFRTIELVSLNEILVAIS